MSPLSFRVLALTLVTSSSSAIAQGYQGGDYASPPEQARSDRGPAYTDPDIITTIGLEGMGHPQGVALGAHGLFEGPNWGVGAQYQAIVSGASERLRAVQQAHLNLNYAILASPIARLRLEGGIGYTGAGATQIYSPLLGVSGALGFLGAFQLEGSVRVAPFPVGQAESTLGFAIGLGRLGLRAGVKRIRIEPVEGVAELDGAIIQGGYLGIAWTL